MAADTIILNNFLTCFMNKNYLRFPSEGINSGVTHAILSLKKILIKYIIVWDMAIVTVGHFAVRTMIPGSILWGHDVAINTSLRFVG